MEYFCLAFFLLDYVYTLQLNSVLREVLTLNISTIGDTPIFRWGIVIRIMPCALLFSPTGTYYNDFFKNCKIQREKKENP